MPTQIIYVFLFLSLCLGENINKRKFSSLEIVKDKDDRVLLFSTLDGTLTAVEQQTGKVKWKVKEKPIVQVPINVSNAIVPIYLPDPRDGSLYLIGDVREPLKKLPFTIPQLVSTSPCRSSDGILYTGKKKDTWFKLDPQSGKKQLIMGWDDYSPTCPIETESFIYIGRTQFSLRMVDEKNTDNKWNVTFYDYTARLMTKEELNNYDSVHFTSASTGQIVTLNRRMGSFLWDRDLGSPVIGVYLLDSEGIMSVPFTSLANHTITHLKLDLEAKDGMLYNTNHMRLYPTLYIGEHMHGLFALPSLIDKNYVSVIGTDNGPLLLGGPHAPDVVRPEYPLPGYNYRLPDGADINNNVLFQSLPGFQNHIIIFTGHYNVPRYSEQKLLTAHKELIVFKDNLDEITDIKETESTKEELNYVLIDERQEEIITETPNWFINQYKGLKLWINRQENKELKISLIVMGGCVIAMFWYLQVQVREFQSQSRQNSQSNQQSIGNVTNVTALAEELPNGTVKIGKITFSPDQILGKGCDGTFVYRGEFDSRRVAVKRLLPECFTFADREVALLRESDAHPNVIRYYCTEQDRMFRYIALELCQATLTEYIQGTCDICQIGPLEILRQATSGLCHLHSLDIVHRDIKPRNVLLSVPDNKGQVKVMISDFGLCKKLQVGRVSFSRRSGVTGTDGWIAPEMLNSTKRTTSAVDMFSLGCLYYYVLSKGRHPFGDNLQRQSNILLGKYDLSDIKGPDWKVNVQIHLITSLISAEPELRPNCKAALDHPMFWNYDNILHFFQEVSDRIEKADGNEEILNELEADSNYIVKSNWRVHIHEEVASDLKKYRSYQENSLRDLLRALRNKKHHLRELSVEAQNILGKDSKTFTTYWLDRFPLLLIHTWMIMQNVAEEQHFKKFYHTAYRYNLETYKDQMLEYISKNPLDLQLLEQNRENDIIRKEKRCRTGVQGSPSKKSELVRSGGLYRNYDDVNVNRNIVRNYQQKKKKIKKVEEPLTWAVQD
ncbi:serine/threonine-protein kinase/endoribonuclease IRE1 isoform X2 [Diorhabda sublineata]|uniref:serine/threonine-protein kinase/endoribonuclease IRE1 isoform X2 n=1 Tax=Diorhabda sublineata TaxID=1163346 RepID=UPI0024E07458|nr:serine/threonine-protein kinase/endoribonuclease IRE1 isoform X2 [Diorhabda sublineata]